MGVSSRSGPEKNIRVSSEAIKVKRVDVWMIPLSSEVVG